MERDEYTEFLISWSKIEWVKTLNDFKEEFPEVYASRDPKNWNYHSIADYRKRYMEEE